MGYTHNWGWTTMEANDEKFAQWSRDVRLLHKYYQQHPPSHPYLNPNLPLLSLYAMQRFPWDTTIHGPDGTLYPVFMDEMVAFNGNRYTENDCEPFIMCVDELKHSRFFYSCKTSGQPYDLLVTAALVRLVHYFPQVVIACGGDVEGLEDGTALCKMAFGTASNPLKDSAYRQHVEEIFSKDY